MNFTYENQGPVTYLVYQINATDAVDSMSLGMLTNNKIAGLAPAVFTQMDEVKYIKYNVSAKIPVKQFFAGAVNRKRLLGVFSGITDAMLSAEDYMIDVSSILLDLDYIFADVSTCETILICLPVLQKEPQAVDLGAFFKNIMFTTQFDQTENCDHVAKLINYLNSTPVFSLVDFKALLEEIKGSVTITEPIPGNAVVQTTVIPGEAPGGTPASIAGNVMGNPAAASEITPPASQKSPSGHLLQPFVSQGTIPQGGVLASQQQYTSPQQNWQVQQPAVPPRKSQPVYPSGQSMQGASQSMQIPSQSAPSMQTPPASQQGAPEAEGKKMSMLGLMMHYSKENAELYKAQKAAKKSHPVQAKAQTAPPVGGAIPAPAPEAKQNPKKKQKEKSKKEKTKGQSASFAVPGAPSANANFAIPKASQQGVPGNAAFTTNAAPQHQAAAAQNAAPAQNIRQTTPQNQAPAMPQSQTMGQQQVQQPMQQPPMQQAAYPRTVPKGQTMNFGETTVLGQGNIGETTVLSAIQHQTVQQPYLVRTRNNEKIMLDKPVYRIGKEKSYVDYFVSDNTAVSRSHANIIARDGAYFVMDTNSTNHTYVDGAMIQSNTETKLEHGAKIRLANEEFTFHLH